MRESRLLNDEQRQLILTRLANRINADGVLVVQAQTHRSQLANKEEVIKRIHSLLQNALHVKKARISTKKTKASIEKRLDSKKKKSEIKSGRMKWRMND